MRIPFLATITNQQQSQTNNHKSTITTQQSQTLIPPNHTTPTTIQVEEEVEGAVVEVEVGVVMLAPMPPSLPPHPLVVVPQTV